MKKTITTILLLNIIFASFAQKDNPGYDEKLAASNFLPGMVQLPCPNI